MKNGNGQNRKYSMQARLMYGKTKSKKWDFNHHVIPPISSSCTYRLETSQRGAKGFAEFGHHADDPTIDMHTPIYIYDRLGEPNKEMLEENLADAEMGDIAVTFSTGMAAVSAALGVCTKGGDEILAHNVLYGCTYSLLSNWYPRYNISTNFIDMRNVRQIADAITEKTRVVYFETPVNPTLELIDISAVVAIVRDANAKRDASKRIYVIIDNTFASPFCQRPIELGADFVVASLTKSLCGFGTDMGGVVVGPKWSYDIISMYRKDFGGALASKSAWPILVYGLPTLPTRMKQQIATANEIATFLVNDPRVDSVGYPGLSTFPQHELAKKQMRDYDGNFAPGSILTFTLKGMDAKEQQCNGERFINHLAENAYTITLAVSLGHIRTLVEHPSSMTHAAIPVEEQLRNGLDPGGIRLSIGLEKAEDILYDISRALEFISEEEAVTV